MNLYKEFFRVMKPGGYLCIQSGFGPGHPRSVDYFADTFNNESEFVNKDVRVEDLGVWKKDIESFGFIDTDVVLTRPCKDEHPQWAWLKTKKPEDSL
jgi:hypothetical protein